MYDFIFRLIKNRTHSFDAIICQTVGNPYSQSRSAKWRVVPSHICNMGWNVRTPDGTSKLFRDPIQKSTVAGLTCKKQLSLNRIECAMPVVRKHMTIALDAAKIEREPFQENRQFKSLFVE